MDIYAFPPIAAVIDGAYRLVSALAELIEPFAGASAAALALVLVTLIVRTVLIPVGVSQVRAEITRRRLAPQLKELQRKYKKHPEVLQRKTMEFYRREKASPFAGCLPLLAQAPVVSVLYSLFILRVVNGHPNDLLTEQLGPVPLGSSFVSLLGQGITLPQLAVFAVLLVVIAAVAVVQRIVTMRFTAANTTGDAVPPMMQNAQRYLSWLPFITVAIGMFVPLAATIYLAVTTAWTLAERTLLRRVLR